MSYDESRLEKNLKRVHKVAFTQCSASLSNSVCAPRLTKLRQCSHQSVYQAHAIINLCRRLLQSWSYMSNFLLRSFPHKVGFDKEKFGISSSSKLGFTRLPSNKWVLLLCHYAMWPSCYNVFSTVSNSFDYFALIFLFVQTTLPLVFLFLLSGPIGFEQSDDLLFSFTFFSFLPPCSWAAPPAVDPGPSERLPTPLL